MTVDGPLCEGRVCVISGAGRGIGRSHAEALAREGAKVVVNDIGVAKDGEAGSADPAREAADAIVDAGGEAVANTDDVSTMAGAASLVAQAIDTWGRVDVVVNNAGILRDKMIVNMTEDDWDAVLSVHLRSTFLLTNVAGNHWRERSKAGDEPDARVINTVSASGIYGQPGQANYGAAKAGIASFTVIAAMELERYGVTVNAICPTAMTRMLEGTRFAESDEAKAGLLDPRYVSPALVWLASPLSRHCTGRVIAASGRALYIAEGWARGPAAPPVDDPRAVDDVIRPLLSAARPNADMRGNIPDGDAG
jgi:NAD(P)-dependent dehydrogenase (short-subunit alcohol dehydrogenase family)